MKQYKWKVGCLYSQMCFREKAESLIAFPSTFFYSRLWKEYTVATAWIKYHDIGNTRLFFIRMPPDLVWIITDREVILKYTLYCHEGHRGPTEALVKKSSNGSLVVWLVPYLVLIDDKKWYFALYLKAANTIYERKK